MRAFARILLAVMVALTFAACGSKESVPDDQISPDGTRPQGQTSFETPMGSGGGMYGGRDSAEDGAAPNAGGQNGTPAQARQIEESDIYKVVGNNLFVLNRYRGLQIIDITNLDAPRLVGHAPMFGYPKDMYVRNGYAYVIVSDYWTYWRDEADGSVDSFYGSQLRIIDARDVTNPQLVGSINLEGDCGDSRIVGHVMYLVSHRYSWWGYYGSTDNVDETSVLSVDIGDPANIHVVDSESFPRNGWDHHVFVNQEAIFLASSEWTNSNYWNGSYQTRIQYIDITDPDGQIQLRGAALAPGRVQDRWALDVTSDVLRVASGENWGNGEVYLTTFDVTNPDAIAQLGQAVLSVNEQLKSARFDGNRGYLVSYRQIDPLFTFDLTDPAHPRLLGELEMSGWLDFMVPMGDRLVALGHDDVTGPDGSRRMSLAVSLIDVSTDQPALLSRATIDGAWGWVPSSNDDFAKVFRVLPEANLVLFPFSSWDPQTWRHIGGVQLIDYFQDHLTKRGVIGNAGWVERGVAHGTDTVLTISSEVFQVMDIADRDSPRLRGRLELARNVTDFALLNGTHTAQLGGDWYQGDTTLTITPIADPDTASPTASLHVPAPYGRLFTNGNMAYVTSVVQVQATATTPGRSYTHVQVVDLTDPASPVERGTLDLPEAVWGSYGYWYWGSGDEVVQVDGSTLAFHHYRYDYYWGDCYDCGYGGGSAGDDVHRVYLVDLSDPDQPRLASTVELPDVDWAWGLRAEGSKLMLSDYDSFQRGDRWYARYYVRQIDVANVDAPVVGPRVNIPGWVVGASGDTIYTLENWWDQAGQRSRNALHALRLWNGQAFLQSSTSVDGYLSNVEFAGAAAFATTYNYSTDANGSWHSTMELLSFDLSNSANIRLAGRAQVPDGWGWLRKVAGGRAFVTGNSGIFSFRVDDVAHPTFEQFFRTYGWVQDVVVHGDRAFLPSGYYGVQVVGLNATP